MKTNNNIRYDKQQHFLRGTNLVRKCLTRNNMGLVEYICNRLVRDDDRQSILLVAIEYGGSHGISNRVYRIPVIDHEIQYAEHNPVNSH